MWIVKGLFCRLLCSVIKVLFKKILMLLTSEVKQNLSWIPHKPKSIIWHLQTFLKKSSYADVNAPIFLNLAPTLKINYSKCVIDDHFCINVQLPCLSWSLILPPLTNWASRQDTTKFSVFHIRPAHPKLGNSIKTPLVWQQAPEITAVALSPSHFYKKPSIRSLLETVSVFRLLRYRNSAEKIQATFPLSVRGCAYTYTYLKLNEIN